MNRKRSYGLRGQVLDHVQHLALCQGILTVEGNPAWTRQACPRCSHLGERFSPGGRGYPSRCRCWPCGWSGDANVVAALNLKRKGTRPWGSGPLNEAAAGRRAQPRAKRAPKEVGLLGGANAARAADAPAA